jgi:hypothetical protein
MVNDVVSTVAVEQIADCALQMTWQQDVRRSDIESAFAEITAFMAAAKNPVHVIIDIRNSPIFPLIQTITCAMKPSIHPKMGLWLVVGSNPLSYLIENSLKLVTGRDLVYWFSDLTEALSYLEKAMKAGSVAS